MEVRLNGEIPSLQCRQEAEATVDKQKRYRQILECMTRPMTAKEVAMELYQRAYTPSGERNYAAPRLTEMCEIGMVEQVGKKKCLWTGKTVTVYRAGEVV